VRKKDLEESERLLGQNVPEKFDLEGTGQYEQPRCPKCGSMDVSFERLMKRVAGAGLFLGLPINVKMKDGIAIRASINGELRMRVAIGVPQKQGKKAQSLCDGP
jgi:hypothetical protein